MLTLKHWPVVLTLLSVSVLCCVESKVFERCELANILHQRHRLELQEIAQWVCIAQHSSGLNTASQALSPSGGSHGIFQISDVYWCSLPGKGSACNIPCHKLRDDNLTDDISCIKRIYADHQRISGNGYTAWNAYEQFCKNNAASYIQDCFPGQLKVTTHLTPVKSYNSYPAQFAGNSIQQRPLKNHGKVYERCELARELYNKHNMPMAQVPTWVCIAEHESRFNTAAVGRLNTDGSADHGLFQVSDLYWCSKDRYSGGGKACGLPCSKLLDGDISDDVSCVKRIYNEHTAISGDGFTAWTVYRPHCRNQRYDHVASCFQNTPPVHSKQQTHQLHKSQYQHKGQNTYAVGFATNPASQYQPNPFIQQIHSPQVPNRYQPPKYNDIFVGSPSSINSISIYKGNIYTRCSLAQELFFKYNFPMQDISTWVCIAEHESQLNTAAVGHLNTDGSAYHGLFQISDRYWCSHDPNGGKACNIPCEKLLDDDLRDDINCIKIIHEEHTRLSGNGFNAWTVYKPHCSNLNIDHVGQCFDQTDLERNEVIGSPHSYDKGYPQGKGKVYKKCELAQELYRQHKMPMDQIPKWVCIAQHESSLNTAAVGRLNTDGSADHGLFQISDLYWCSHDQYGGKACNIACNKLLDSDISDDVRCIKVIYEEHTRISGDGFNAWTVYKPHCQHTEMDHIRSCFSEQEIKEAHVIGTPIYSNSLVPQNSVISKNPPKGKFYKKCELAQELYHQHKMPMDQIPKWVCIAQHESSLNTAAVGRLNTDGSADHGLFQISDLYWCSHDQYGGKACNIACDKLLDPDISDDVRCIKVIYEEHTRISGDGFNAWTVYNPHCRNTGMDHIRSCFSEQELKQAHNVATPIYNNSIVPQNSVISKNPPKGKIYKICELAEELYHQYKMPMDQIPKWVCIAQHESSLNTAAVGRLNTDGSANHGLFQISDLYWCSHDQYGGKACNIACDKLLDPDISDDVRCIKVIYDEHTRISGDGFNAWTVYKPHCRNTGMDHIRSCFSEQELKQAHNVATPIHNNSIVPQNSVISKNPPKGKIYKKCELAQELYHQHKMPMDQIPKWVCIAQHESSLNTAAVGRLNTDGSANHGLFQISDLYWCSHDQYGGKACNIACDKLLDPDISDDVRCIKVIYKEHTRISGDGFNAWTVYKPHCRNRGMEEIRSCFTSNEIDEFQRNLIESGKHVGSKPIEQGIHGHKIENGLAPQQKPLNKPFKTSVLQNYANNPFLQKIITHNNNPTPKIPTQSQQANFMTNALLQGSQPGIIFKADSIANNHNYKNNPFINGAYKIKTNAQDSGHATKQQTAVSNSQITLNANQFSTDDVQSRPSYSKNPFLNGSYKPIASNYVYSKPSEAIKQNTYNSNPFLNGNVKISTSEKLTTPLHSYQNNPFLPNTSTHALESSKPYLNSNSFRATTTTNKPTTTATKPNTTTTTKKPTTTWSTTTRKPTVAWNTFINQKTTALRTTTTTRKSTTTAAKPVTISTTKKPRTTWSTTTRKPTVAGNKISSRKTTASGTTTTTRKPTTTAAKPITTTTTKQPRTTWSTTTSKPTVAWNTFINQKITASGTTTTKPIVSATTTLKPTTTWSWQNQKYEKSTLKPLTTTTTATKYSKTTTSTTASASKTTTKATTTKSWQNKNYANYAWSGPNSRYSNTTTTKTITTKRTTIPWNWHSQNNNNNTTIKTTASPKATTSWNSFTTKLQTTTTTTSKPLRTTWNWRNEQSNIKQKSTKSHLTTTQIPITKKSITTPKHISTTTRTTTKRPTASTTIQQALKPAKPINSESYRITTTKPQTTTRKPSKLNYNENQLKTTPTTKSSLSKTLTTFKSQVTTTTIKSSTLADYEKYKKDPFQHPFFSKVNEQFKKLKSNATTTKRPPYTATKLQSFRDSSYYQDYKNNAPVILTLPHMLGASNEYTKTIRGLTPDAKKHQTFVDVQHLTGTPLQGGKRVQFNMFLKSINRITITENLSTVLMPAIWVEEGIQLNNEMVTFFKKRLINTLKTLNVVHWASMFGGVGLAAICLIYYVVHRRKPAAVVEAQLK